MTTPVIGDVLKRLAVHGLPFPDTIVHEYNTVFMHWPSRASIRVCPNGEASAVFDVCIWPLRFQYARTAHDAVEVLRQSGCLG